MPRTAIQLPYRRKDAQRVGARMFRKQVLPMSKIDYRGRTLDFTRSYLEELASNFTARAMDQVPFLLADPQNQHHSDPERFRGDVKGVEVTDDGLYALIETTENGATLLKENPKLGVSARVVEDHPKGRVLEHVLGTLNPVVTGMAGWEEISLSADTEVVDLTAARYKGEGMDALTEQEVTALRELLSNGPETGTETAAPTDERAPGTGTDQTFSQEQVDAAVARILNEENTEEDGTEGTEADAAKEPVALSAKARQTIDLANTRAEQAANEVAQLRTENAAKDFELERSRYLQAGVPPIFVDLAKPLLEQPASVIELSNGEKLDAAGTVRKILDEAKGFIDLSERGSNSTESQSEREKAQEMASDEKWPT